jgi:hypothetical protein
MQYSKQHESHFSSGIACSCGMPYPYQLMIFTGPTANLPRCRVAGVSRGYLPTVAAWRACPPRSSCGSASTCEWRTCARSTRHAQRSRWGRSDGCSAVDVDCCAAASSLALLRGRRCQHYTRSYASRTVLLPCVRASCESDASPWLCFPPVTTGALRRPPPTVDAFDAFI